MWRSSVYQSRKVVTYNMQLELQRILVFRAKCGTYKRNGVPDRANEHLLFIILVTSKQDNHILPQDLKILTRSFWHKNIFLLTFDIFQNPNTFRNHLHHLLRSFLFFFLLFEKPGRL